MGFTVRDVVDGVCQLTGDEVACVDSGQTRLAISLASSPLEIRKLISSLQECLDGDVSEVVVLVFPDYLTKYLDERVSQGHRGDAIDDAIAIRDLLEEDAQEIGSWIAAEERAAQEEGDDDDEEDEEEESPERPLVLPPDTRERFECPHHKGAMCLSVFDDDLDEHDPRPIE